MSSRKSDSESGRDFVTALARGLMVVRAFSRDKPEMTLAEVAAATRLSAATARRCLHTLRDLGYVSSFGRKFMLRSKILDLGAAFWSSMGLEHVAQVHLREIVDKVGDSASLAVLEGADVLYLAHAAHHRTVRLAAGIGVRFPAYATSLGRAMLAYLEPQLLDHYLTTVEMRPLTHRTETDSERLRQALADVRRDGYAAIEDELDYGLASIAVPIIVGETAVAAINSSANSARRDKAALVEERLPILRRAAGTITRAVEQSPALLHSLSNGASRTRQPA